MSNRVSKIKKNIDKNEEWKKSLLELTTAGSIALTAAKFAGVKDIDKIYKVFDGASHCSFNNLQELTYWIWNKLGAPDDYLDKVVLLTHDKGLYSSCVTAEVEVDGETILLPIGFDGSFPAIMSPYNRDEVTIEKVF